MSWLDSMPSSWELRSPKSLFNERRTSNLPDDVHLTPSQKYGVLPQSEYIELTGGSVVLNLTGQNAMKHVEPNDFIIHLRSFQGGLERARQSGKVSTAYTVVEPKNATNPEFYKWLFKSKAFIQELQTTTNQLRDGQSIRWTDFVKVPLPTPSLDEQRAIADYLDRETQKIDELIAEQRGLIEKLSERRRSLVTRLVTRGIDDNVEMAEVPNRWLDFVPMQWEVTRFRFVAKIGNIMVDPKDTRIMHDVLIAPNHVEGDTGRLLAIETADEQGADSNKFRVCEGQIVYSKIRPALNKAVIAPCDCLCSADMYPISFDSVRVSTRYALYQMLSRPIHDYVTERSMRVKMPKVNREELADLPWLLPPVEVQEEISDEIDEKTSRIDELIGESEELIALSQERRAALITAAVTGQIDVREAV